MQPLLQVELLWPEKGRRWSPPEWIAVWAHG
jgi:hypothetical protein